MIVIDRQRDSVEDLLEGLRAHQNAFFKLENRRIKLYLPGRSSSPWTWVEALLASLNTSSHGPADIKWNQVLRDVQTVAAFIEYTNQFLAIRDLSTTSIEGYHSAYPLFREVSFQISGASSGIAQLGNSPYSA